MDWQLIQIFLKVAEAGSLSQASASLNMSQPTVGRYIAELETQVGGSLFNRQRTGMELSPAGLDLVEYARAMAQSAEQFQLKAAGANQSLSGTVRLTASHVVATYILPPLITQFQRQEPDIQLEIVASNTTENLLARDADIAIRMFQPTQQELISCKVNELSLGVYASEVYLNHFGTPHDLEQLMQHRLVGYDRAEVIIKGMAAAGFKIGREFFVLRTDDEVAYWEYVKAGAGIGFGANFIARQSPHLQRLFPELPIGALPIWLTAHQELRTNRRIRRVMDFFSKQLRALDL